MTTLAKYLSNRQPAHYLHVDSSAIQAVAWDADTLFVIWNGGNVYAYIDVPFNIFNLLLVTDSVGKFVNRFVKGHYDFEGLTA